MYARKRYRRRCKTIIQETTELFATAIKVDMKKTLDLYATATQEAMFDGNDGEDVRQR